MHGPPGRIEPERAGNRYFGGHHRPKALSLTRWAGARWLRHIEMNGPGEGRTHTLRVAGAALSRLELQARPGALPTELPAACAMGQGSNLRPPDSGALPLSYRHAAGRGLNPRPPVLLPGDPG